MSHLSDKAWINFCDNKGLTLDQEATFQIAYTKALIASDDRTGHILNFLITIKEDVNLPTNVRKSSEKLIELYNLERHGDGIPEGRSIHEFVQYK